MFNEAVAGADWLVEQVLDMDDAVEILDIIEYNEQTRYLPEGVTPRPGFIRFDLFPYMIEPLQRFNPWSDAREVNMKKGVQVAFTTLLESVLLYYIGQIRTVPGMFLTADKELASRRMDNNIIPMLHESGLRDRIRSADTGNKRKTGMTKDMLQWEGGGSLVYDGAMNATKMRMISVLLMLKDELDGWKRSVGNDGNSDSLTDDRASAYWELRKILRGSTPLLYPSLIDDAYNQGDKRQYHVLCRACSFPQVLRMEHVNKTTGVVGGFKWDLEDGALINDSVRYCCANCGHEHFEHDKEKLFALEEGAHWRASCKPRVEGVYSYHLPAFYSPVGFRPWYKNISDYIKAYDPVAKQTKDIDLLQNFYNNVLGEPFRVSGTKVMFQMASGHRRTEYRRGEIPNLYAAEHSGSRVLFLVCAVDVHKRNLAVSIMGVCQDLRTYVIDYDRITVGEDEVSCEEKDSPAWAKLQKIIEEKIYTADDGQRYRIMLSFIDASYSTDTVVGFCSSYADGVYPIFGRERPAKVQKIEEFAQFKTRAGTDGYRILVDHYKDRLAPVLRRDWHEELGAQDSYHFNAPIDLTDKQIKELTAEERRKKVTEKGIETYEWYRPGNKPNELWDLLVYTHCASEVIAYSICIEHFGLDNVDWPQFWAFADDPQHDNIFGRLAKAG